MGLWEDIVLYSTQHDLFFSPVVLWWSLGFYQLDIWIWNGQSASFIVGTDVVRALKVILFVFKLRVFFRNPGKLLWKGKQNHRINCFGIDFRYPLSNFLLQAGSSVSSGSELYPCGSWTLQGWRSSPGSLVSWLSSMQFLFLYPAGIYSFNLWLLPLILLMCIIVRSPSQLLDNPPGRQGQAAVRPSWSWSSPAPFGSAHRTSPPVPTNLMAFTRLFQVCKWL